MRRKYFGTDGVRGRVGEPPITADWILKLGRAVGIVLARDDKRAVVIGKDTRVSGYMFESALEAGLAASGANVLLLGPMPTPAVAYLTRTLYACAGIVISASHNSFEDNGIKFFSANGEKLSDDVEQAIENEIDEPFVTVNSAHMGKAARVDDAAGRYIEFCKGTMPFGTLLSGMRIALDCANGATYKVAPAILRELGAKVHVIGNTPDGMNINDRCGSTQPKAMQEHVLQSGADLGIALDGDGDRVVFSDGDGELVDGDELLYIIACARKAAGTLPGGVVGTVMTNFGLETAFANLGIPFIRTAVGDRHIHRALIEHGWILGGEASGHLLSLDRTSTGDGIVSALQVLEIMAQSGKSLKELRQGMKKFPQVMINVPVSAGARKVFQDSDTINRAMLDVEAELNGQGRVILRPSGTEPLIRVTLEGADLSQVQRLAEQLADTVRAELGG
ncbi:MAG: phosphoglucosamine mutase [Gammaproteobacteria bacterium]|nr:phosphoglucosamine mutase [Gammaproteobacteria bacterium]MBT8053336.1 phosphoglucosamine mutase [Gammaproteobacteria bacterium]